MESSSNTKEGERQMEIKTPNVEDEMSIEVQKYPYAAMKKVITFSNEHYQLSRIREIKVIREICNGKQRKITEWVF